MVVRRPEGPGLLGVGGTRRRHPAGGRDGGRGRLRGHRPAAVGRAAATGTGPSSAPTSGAPTVPPSPPSDTPPAARTPASPAMWNGSGVPSGRGALGSSAKHSRSRSAPATIWVLSGTSCDSTTAPAYADHRATTRPWSYPRNPKKVGHPYRKSYRYYRFERPTVRFSPTELRRPARPTVRNWSDQLCGDNSRAASNCLWTIGWAATGLSPAALGPIRVETVDNGEVQGPPS